MRQQIHLDPRKASGPSAGYGGADQIFITDCEPLTASPTLSTADPDRLPAVSARAGLHHRTDAWYRNEGFDPGGTGVYQRQQLVVGTVFSGTSPVAAVAIVSVVNTVSSGALQAWNGGTTLSAGAVLNWNAGDRLTNTTVIPMDRTLAPFPGSGGKRDIAVYNNSGDPVDFVIDVVGYFIENTATPFDCVQLNNSAPIAAASDGFVPYAACTAGYSFIAGFCMGGFGTILFDTGPVACGIHNSNGTPISGQSPRFAAAFRDCNPTETAVPSLDPQLRAGGRCAHLCNPRRFTNCAMRGASALENHRLDWRHEPGNLTVPYYRPDQRDDQESLGWVAFGENHSVQRRFSRYRTTAARWRMGSCRSPVGRSCSCPRGSRGGLFGPVYEHHAQSSVKHRDRGHHSADSHCRSHRCGNKTGGIFNGESARHEFDGRGFPAAGSDPSSMGFA